MEEVKLEDVHNLVGGLPNHINLNYLTHLAIMKDLQTHDRLPCGPLQASRLRPIFAARNMKHFELNFKCSMAEIDHVFLEEMARSWPGLETLFLIGSEG